MARDDVVNLSRRRFLQAGLAAGAGLTLGVYVPRLGAEALSGLRSPGTAARGPETFAPNAFVRIDPDDTVTVIAKHLEMGQGTYTGLATLIAEELDAAWEQVRVEGAPANVNLYNNLLWGKLQGTGGSTAIANAYTQMRRAGAAAREMLVEAAAREWNVSPATIRVRDGVVRHAPSGREARFGALVERAAEQEVPVEPFLKDPEEFRLIGTHLPRKDGKEKTDGSALYTQDVRLEGMLTAVVARPPRFGARPRAFDASEARRIEGVTDVVRIPTGVAVLGKDFWSASRGRDALVVEWDESGAETRGSDELMRHYKELAKGPGAVARADGDAEAGLAGAAKTVEAELEFPYLAHAAMEPLNCVVRLANGGCEIWNGEQFQTPDQNAVAALLGLEPDQVKINMLYAGGSFGRRANPHSDYVVEAASIAKAIDGRAPVKMLWTREDDMRAGYYRPMYFHRLRGGLDAEGNPVAWQHRIVGQSIMTGTLMEANAVKEGVDNTSVEGAANMPYAVPNVGVDLHSPKVGVPVQWWRSVGSTHTAFAVETFIDELAEAAGRDPVEFRRGLLKNHPRRLGVLELAAEKAGWGDSLPAGRGRGIAVHESFNSFVAEVAEVTVRDDDSFSVDRVVIAVDCGVAVNPDMIKAQMEGG
ncbi:MAG: xanthine dehydrogenase family protein molybdopterin-binding subunit, partial [Gammaproteobacteria bacterium]|nr:xanthine dehydrogenase family protein molybdopterin-binding subunit [Gammaproteobacteria bacterium]